MVENNGLVGTRANRRHRCSLATMLLLTLLICLGSVFGALPFVTVCSADAQAIAKDKEPQSIRAIWSLTFVRSPMATTDLTQPIGGQTAGAPSTPGQTGASTGQAPGRESAAPDTVDQVVKALNTIYGENAVQRAGRTLFLAGSDKQVLEMKRLLAVIDCPWPQVQMDIWAIQVSGDQAAVAERVGQILDDARETQQALQWTQRQLFEVAAEAKDRLRDRAVLDELYEAGFDINPVRPLTVAEALMFLGLADNRQELVKSLQERMRREDAPPGVKTALEALGKRARRRSPTLTMAKPFQRLEIGYGISTAASDRKGVQDFARAWRAYQKDEAELRDWNAPERLRSAGGAADRLLKSAMDAFAEDMRDMFLIPLLERVQRHGGGSRSDGTALVGKARIVVTSSMEAELVPQVTSFVETTPVTLLGGDALKAVIEHGNLANTITTLAPLLETKPTFSEIAPGIGIRVRPTVLPDGGSARLQVDLGFGLPSESPDSSHAAVINRHHVSTDAIVTAFDLFDISSFSITTSHRRPPGFVPILGQLPLLGCLFQWPRSDEVTHHESVILVNSVILPRALDMARLLPES